MIASKLIPTQVLYVFAALLLASCGALQETAYTADDAYYSKDGDYQREVVASTERVAEQQAGTVDGEEDYYDPDEASRQQTSPRSYYDATYGDPQYYRYDRFAFNNSGWGSRFGNPFIQPRFNGYFGAGSFYGGGSSFYGYDPFASNFRPFNDPWSSPYGYGGWNNGFSPYSSFYSPYAGFGGQGFYGSNFYNPYGGFYNPYSSFYGGGYAYCPPGGYGSYGSVGVGLPGSYGSRGSINAVVGNSNTVRPRFGRPGSIDLVPTVAAQIEADRSRNSSARTTGRTGAEAAKQTRVDPNRSSKQSRPRLNSPSRNNSGKSSRDRSGYKTKANENSRGTRGNSGFDRNRGSSRSGTSRSRSSGSSRSGGSGGRTPR